MTFERKKKLSSQERIDLIETLQNRFEQNTQRHQGLNWLDVKARLDANPDKLIALFEMERTGGEPDVVSFDQKKLEIAFYDCSPESPKERRSLCYDEDALNSRKENKPKGSAINMAEHMGIEVLSEQQYHALQQLGNFDMKTSSWVITPTEIRKLGGAIFCDRRYNHVFTYHNGAESYYAARGFRGFIIV